MYAPPSLKGENLATVLAVAWHEQQRSAFQTLVAVLQAIVVTIGLGFAAVTLHYNGKTLDYNSKTLDESNRIAWRTFLDNKSTELGRDVLNHDALH